MNEFMSDGAEMLDVDFQKFQRWAASADDMDIAAVFKKIGGDVGKVKVGDMRKFLIGQNPEVLSKAAGAIPGVTAKNAGRFAGTGLGKFMGRVAPGVSVAFNVADVADIATNDTSMGNKIMDGTFMAGGAAIGGMVGGPLGASTGASLGKMASDSTQWLFGDKKSPEQRKMEEALKALQRGY